MKGFKAMLRSVAAAGMIALSALSAAAQDIVDIIAKDPELSTFAGLVKAGGLEAAMKAKGPITVLVPTNAAFARLNPGTVERLTQAANAIALDDILKYHVMPNDYPTARLAKAYQDTFKITTPEGNALLVDVTRLKQKKGPLVVDGVAITRPEIKASNGTVYVIDHVLLPPKHRSLRAPAAPAPAAGAATKP